MAGRILKYFLLMSLFWAPPGSSQDLTIFIRKIQGALESSNYSDLREACEEALRSGHTEAQIIPGMAEPYIPHFFIGLAYFLDGDFALAEAELSIANWQEREVVSRTKYNQMLPTLLLTSANYKSLAQIAQTRGVRIARQNDSLKIKNQAIAELQNEVDAHRSREQGETPAQAGEQDRDYLAAIDLVLQGNYQEALNRLASISNDNRNFTRARTFREFINTELLSQPSMGTLTVRDTVMQYRRPEPRVVVTRPDPSEFDPVKGSFVVRKSKYMLTGWVKDDQEIDSVDFWIDGMPLSKTSGERIVRKPDLANKDSLYFSELIPLKEEQRTSIVINAADKDADGAHKITRRLVFQRELNWWERIEFQLGIAGGSLFLILIFVVIHLIRRIRAKELASVPLPDVPNPYEASQPVRGDSHMIRPEAYLNQLESLIEKNSLALWGERRIGKTSILFQFEDLLNENLRNAVAPPIYPVFFSLDGKRENRFLGDLLASIYATLLQNDLSENSGFREAIEKKIDSSQQKESSDLTRIVFVKELELIMHELQKIHADALLVLLLDEWDNFYAWDPSWLSWMREIFCQGRIAVHYVSAGVRRQDIGLNSGSPWYNAQINIQLEPFDPEACRHLIVGPNVLHFDKSAVDYVLKVTLGRFFLIQQTCSYCFVNAKQKKNKRITLNDARQAFHIGICNHFSRESRVQRILKELAAEARNKILSGKPFPEQLLKKYIDALFEFGLVESAHSGALSSVSQVCATPALIELIKGR
ncbi:hypothetical protein JXJ21_25255 [candidate division KSB1 bacterium]|nr:hypothetical protein [candidate division KSB1 bacterium]